jgi:Domain of unknown function (DUF4505)
VTREYFYDIDLGGRLFHDGGELTEPRFLDFFFGRLRVNDTGRFPGFLFLSPCAGELNFVRAEDRPIVFQKLLGEDLVYAASLRQRFDPAQVRVSGVGRLYHPAPVGEMGLMHSRLALRLGDSIVEAERGYVLRWQDREHLMRPL